MSSRCRRLFTFIVLFVFVETIQLLRSLNLKNEPSAAGSNSPFSTTRATSLLSTKSHTSTKAIVVPRRAQVKAKHGDIILQKGLWDGSPFVLESHKLLFLTTPKVSCTVFKQLFRRMMGFENWKSQLDTLPHNPKNNGLVYLSEYAKNLTKVNHMLNSPDWTFAVFVRDPKERMLSAYLDKAGASTNWYLQQRCCKRFPKVLTHNSPGCANDYSALPWSAPVMSFDTWVKDFVPKCPDHHWTPQRRQLPDRIWPAINFVGHMDNLFNDTKKLLQSIRSTKTGQTAWEEYGATGWGKHSNCSMFDPRLQSAVSHRTDAKQQLKFYYNITPGLEDYVEKYYKADYSHDRLQLSPKRLVETTEKATQGKGGIYLCGWGKPEIAREVFPDYSQNFIYNYDNHTLSSKATSRDILIFGMHGACSSHANVNHEFPGKILYVNAESRGDARQQNNKQIFQIGFAPDSDQSVLVYDVALALMKLPAATHWPRIADPTKKAINTQKYKAAVYISRNCAAFREKAVVRIANTTMPIHYGGQCQGGVGAKTKYPIAPMPNQPTSLHHWHVLSEYYSEYTFCIVMENSKKDLYITEKILMAFLGGCVPIYYGTKEVFDIFNKDAFVFYDVDNHQAAQAQLQYLVDNSTAYEEMLYHQPILANGNQTVRDFFSLSDRLGDGALKQKIRRRMGIDL